MDLFDAPLEPIASGDVPREPFKGVVWDEAAEADFVKMVDGWRRRFPAIADEPVALERVVTSSRWQVDLQLVHAVVRKEIEAGRALLDAYEKRRANTVWVEKYGALMADTIVRCLKDPFLAKAYGA